MLKSVNQRLVSSQFVYKESSCLSIISYTRRVRIVYNINVSFAFTKYLARALVEYILYACLDSFSSPCARPWQFSKVIRMPGLGHTKIVMCAGSQSP